MSAPYGLTVGQLKALLASMPESFDDRIVVIAQDAEGNGFDTLSEVAVGWLNNREGDEFQGRSRGEGDTWEEVEVEATKDYLTDEDALEENAPSFVIEPEHDHPAICLWP